MRSVGMKPRSFITCGALAALMVFVVQGAIAADKQTAAKAGSTDEQFIKKAADANMTEIQLGKIAGDNAQSQEVKDFGQRMVSDHTKIGDDLKPIADKLNARIPAEVIAKHKEIIDRLGKLKGDAFDKPYAKAMVQDHEKVISMFEKEESEGKDAELKKFVQNTLPILKEHLEMAKKLPSSK